MGRQWQIICTKVQLEEEQAVGREACACMLPAVQTSDVAEEGGGGASRPSFFLGSSQLAALFRLTKDKVQKCPLGDIQNSI